MLEGIGPEIDPIVVHQGSAAYPAYKSCTWTLAPTVEPIGIRRSSAACGEKGTHASHTVRTARISSTPRPIVREAV